MLDLWVLKCFCCGWDDIACQNVHHEHPDSQNSNTLSADIYTPIAQYLSDTVCFCGQTAPQGHFAGMKELKEYWKPVFKLAKWMIIADLKPGGFVKCAVIAYLFSRAALRAPAGGGEELLIRLIVEPKSISHLQFTGFPTRPDQLCYSELSKDLAARRRWRPHHLREGNFHYSAKRCSTTV